MPTAPPRRPLLRRLSVRIALGVAALLVIVGAFVFEPWKLVVDQTVDEAAPAAAIPAAPGEGVPDQGVPDQPAPAQAGPVVLARGALISHEHESSGTVELLRLPDGSTVLRLEDLRTSNGPRLKVWLADSPVLAGTEGWYVFDDGRHVDLGDLKGNIGSSNHPVPPGVDLAGLTSVTIWCDRFDVSFAAAALA